MVKIRDFSGAVFHPHNYQLMLSSNIEHLEQIPMSKTFRTQEMLASGMLVPTNQPLFFLYTQKYIDHTSHGILAEISLEDYHLKHIKRHEKTLHRPGLNHQTYLEEHVGPVVTSHRFNKHLDQLINVLYQSQPAFAEWTTIDGRNHSLRCFRKQDHPLEQLFANIQSLYILDGHHRFEAAYQHYLLSDKQKENDLWIQSIIYSSEYVMVHAQHRVFESVSTDINILDEICKLTHLSVVEIPQPEGERINAQLELQQYEIILKTHGRFFGINFNISNRNTLEKITTVRLQNQIFNEILDTETVKQLKFVPGIIDQEEIYSHEVAFFVRQPEIETLFEIADQNGTLPPKSTWIEPKPCSHMVVRLRE